MLALLAVAGGASPAGAGGVVRPRSSCTDPSFHLYPAKWVTPMDWWFRARSTPRGMRRSAAEAVLRAAASNLVHGRNACGLDADLTATEHYMGRTRTHADITGTSTCGTPDGKSVVAFGVLAPQDLALTCWWTIGGRTVEADIKLNKADFRWVPRAGPDCAMQWSVEAVATHEFGHAFGLGHVYGMANGHLTMSPLVAPCQNSEDSLGLGDIRGLEAKY